MSFKYQRRCNFQWYFSQNLWNFQSVSPNVENEIWFLVQNKLLIGTLVNTSRVFFKAYHGIMLIPWNTAMIPWKWCCINKPSNNSLKNVCSDTKKTHLQLRAYQKIEIIFTENRYFQIIPYSITNFLQTLSLFSGSCNKSNALFVLTHGINSSYTIYIFVYIFFITVYNTSKAIELFIFLRNAVPH